MAKRGKTRVSQTAISGIELQNALPGARVVYASATGATEAANLCYCHRLGLWGTGTAFSSPVEFVSQIEAGGVAAMELIARDMKQMGMYISRGLSFQGVEYDRITHVLSPEQVELYDAACEAWQITLQNIHKALEVICGGEPDGKMKSAAMSAYWGAHQRFFNVVMTAMQMPSVLIDIEKELAAGNSCVLQLVNTNESAMERALADMDEDDDLGDLDMTPKEMLIQLVEHCFPVQAQEAYTDLATKKDKFRPVHDSNGNPVEDAEAVAMREALLNTLSTMRCPEGPLEMLMNHFGTENVAEVTGRSRRVVRTKEGNTTIEARSVAKTIAEASEFQSGKRRILVFSDAGGTGQSYHAGANCKNQQRRIHYLVQAGWCADQAVQGFGRTHRSSQVSAPMYKLVSTNLRGQARFISTIARRLDQLGALTKGERKAATEGIFKAGDNLESPWARQALIKFYNDLHGGNIEGVTMEDFETQTGLSLCTDEGELKMELPPITRFLNRLLSLKVAMQNNVFAEFESRLMTVIRNAAEAGILDLGVETVRADRIDKVSETVVYTDPSGAQTKLVEFKLKWRTVPKSFDSIMEQREATYHAKVEFFAKNVRSGRIYAFCQASDRTMSNGSVVSYYSEIGPATRRPIPREDLRAYDENPHTYQRTPRWVRFEVGDEQNMAAARQMWDAEIKELPEFEESKLCLVSGIILPIWDRLPQDNVKVKRLQVTDTGERFLGRIVEDKDVDDMLIRLGVQTKESLESPETMAARLVAQTHTYELVNGWRLKGARVNGEVRIEIVGPNFGHLQILKQSGVFFERHNFAGRFFIPTGTTAADCLRKLTEDKPVASVKKAA